MEVILGDATHTPLVRIGSDSHVPLSKSRVPLLRKVDIVGPTEWAQAGNTSPPWVYSPSGLHAPGTWEDSQFTVCSSGGPVTPHLLCYGLSIVSPRPHTHTKFTCWNLYTQCGGLLVGREDLINGFRDYSLEIIRDVELLRLSLLPLWGHMRSLPPRRGPSPNSIGTSISDFQPPDSKKYISIVHKPPSLCCFVTAAGKHDETLSWPVILCLETRILGPGSSLVTQ